MSKLLGEWFWTDRWIGSSAFLLPLEPRGLYREMLTQAWRRGGKLPNNHDAIKRAVGATDEEWDRSWPLIERYWRVRKGFLLNPTQAEIYAQTTALQDTRVESGRRGGLKAQALKRQAKLQAQLQANTEAKPDSPSPSPSPSQISGSFGSGVRAHAREATNNNGTRKGLGTGIGSGVMAGSLPRDHRSHVQCGRVCVPEFLHAEFLPKLSGDAEARLTAFYKSTLASIPADQDIGDEPLKFWRAHFAAAFAKVAPSSGPKRLTIEELMADD